MALAFTFFVIAGLALVTSSSLTQAQTLNDSTCSNVACSGLAAGQTSSDCTGLPGGANCDVSDSVETVVYCTTSLTNVCKLQRPVVIARCIGFCVGNPVQACELKYTQCN